MAKKNVWSMARAKAQGRKDFDALWAQKTQRAQEAQGLLAPRYDLCWVQMEEAASIIQAWRRGALVRKRREEQKEEQKEAAFIYNARAGLLLEENARARDEWFGWGVYWNRSTIKKNADVIQHCLIAETIIVDKAYQ